jgi:hypothetical protein
MRCVRCVCSYSASESVCVVQCSLLTHLTRVAPGGVQLAVANDTVRLSVSRDNTFSCAAVEDGIDVIRQFFDVFPVRLNFIRNGT